jgi:hypothetical protein
MEMEQFVELMNKEDDDAIEDAYFMKILKEREKEEDMPDGLEILKRKRDERKNSL